MFDYDKMFVAKVREVPLQPSNQRADVTAMRSVIFKDLMPLQGAS